MRKKGILAGALALMLPHTVQAQTVVGFKDPVGDVPLASIGGGDPAAWSYQVVMAGNEGFPTGTDLMTRKVNEYEGQHRFGGGNDADCDPNVMDVLAGAGAGAPNEVAIQSRLLSYKCGDDGKIITRTMLTMLRK